MLTVEGFFNQGMLEVSEYVKEINTLETINLKDSNALLETVFDEVILFDTQDFFTKPELKEVRGNAHSFIFDLNQSKALGNKGPQ